MKQGWEYKKLGEVASYINGYAFKPEQWSDRGLPIIRIQNLNNSSAPYNYYQGNIPETYIVEPGDLLISWSASLGAYIWTGPKALLNQHIFKVAFNKSDIDKYYLKYAVTSKLIAMGELVHGATMKHIVKKDFDNTKIPVPPLPEQQTIVAELDKISELIDKGKEQLKELDNLAQAIFYDMFGDPITNEKGWKQSLVKDVAVVKIGPFGSLLHAKDYISGGIPVINPIHMSDGKVKYAPDFTVTTDKAKEMTPYFLKKDDIIFGRRGDIGRCALVTEDQNNYICGTGSLFIRFNEKINPVFSIRVFYNKSVTQYLVERASGATMLNINCGIIENMPVITPPLSLQQSFAEKVEAIEKQKTLVTQSIQECQTLFDSRMDYYFGD